MNTQPKVRKVTVKGLHCDYNGCKRTATKSVTNEDDTASTIYCCDDDLFRAKQDIRDAYKPNNDLVTNS